MKKIIYIPLLTLAILITGCSDDFLAREDLYKVSSGTFYSTTLQIDEGLNAAYSCLQTADMKYNSTLTNNLLSDLCFGGGGELDAHALDTDAFERTQDDHYDGLWGNFYSGILRANLVLENIDNVEYEDENLKKQRKGEALFLRAFFNFRLTKYFGQITLKNSSASGEDSHASYEDIYDLIASDLQLAIKIMPATNIATIGKDQRGHITKWAAEALMAKVWLFYTGYHNKSEIVLNDGTTITKTMAIDWIDDCIANSGHYLYDDFRELWPISSTSTDTAGDLSYPWAINRELEWVGDGNDESVFMIKYSSIYPDWSTTTRYVNTLQLFQSVRGQDEKNTYPYGKGWGWCTGNPQLYDAYADNDIRKEATFLNLNNPEEGIVTENYEYNKDMNMHETYLYNKKYTSVTYNTKGTKVEGMYYAIWGGNSSYMLNHQQDEVIIRFSDVLLMAAELKEDITLLNKVHQRAGLDPLPAYTLALLQEERKLELAYEGVRYHDILRWNIAEQEFANVKNIPVKNNGKDETYNATYRSETKGLLPFPQEQINISNGGMKQNAGW